MASTDEQLQCWPGPIDAARELPHVRSLLGCIGILCAIFCGSFATRNVLADAEKKV